MENEDKSLIIRCSCCDTEILLNEFDTDLLVDALYYYWAHADTKQERVRAKNIVESIQDL